MNDREKWLAQRKLGIGGSDAAAILGYSPWKSEMDVYMDKLGLNPQSTGTGDPHRQFLLNLGTELEPVIARLYEKETKERVYQPTVVPVRHPEHDFLIGTPDRLVQGRTIGVELKSESLYADEFGEPGTDQVPYNYLIQCAHYMAVMDYDQWDVALLKAGSAFLIYHIHRDIGLEMEMIDWLRDWWNLHIIRKVPPDMDGSEGWRRYLKQKYPRDLLPVKRVDDQALSAVAFLKTIRQTIDDNELAKTHAENALKDMIGEHAGITGDFGTITWRKSRDTQHTDWQAVASDLVAQLAWTPQNGAYQSIVAKHTGPRPGVRRFLFSPRKGWQFNGPAFRIGNRTTPEIGGNARDGLNRLGSSSEGAHRSQVRDGGTPPERP